MACFPSSAHAPSAYCSLDGDFRPRIGSGCLGLGAAAWAPPEKSCIQDSVTLALAWESSLGIVAQSLEIGFPQLLQLGLGAGGRIGDSHFHGLPEKFQAGSAALVNETEGFFRSFLEKRNHLIGSCLPALLPIAGRRCLCHEVRPALGGFLLQLETGLQGLFVILHRFSINSDIGDLILSLIEFLSLLDGSVLLVKAEWPPGRSALRRLTPLVQSLFSAISWRISRMILPDRVLGRLDAK